MRKGQLLFFVFVFNSIVCLSQVTANFTYKGGCQDSTVEFTNTSHGATKYFWDFGDGAILNDTSRAFSPTWQYNAPGDYTVTLIVLDTFTSIWDTNTTLITVYAMHAAYTYVSGCAGDSLSFTNISTVPNNTIWHWNFGDSTSFTPTSTLQNPKQFYGIGGQYYVTLTATLNGCIDSISQIINVYYIPVADFTADYICTGDTTVFRDLSTVVADNISTWHWSFDDGTDDTIQHPKHYYSINGDHSISLTVTSLHGCINRISKTITISDPPTADFVSDTSTANINQRINFTDRSIGAKSWVWNFGDASVSINQNTGHTYSNGGMYEVCLFVSDSVGCMDTLCKPETILLPPSLPSAFSPNGDGQNDIFSVCGGPFQTLDLKIYNNWGELIFGSNKQSDGWDGKYKGRDQAIGVYVYTLAGVTIDGIKFNLSGNVTLLR